MLFPDPLRPTMKQVSPAGKKNDDFWRTRVSGLVGYAKLACSSQQEGRWGRLDATYVNHFDVSHAFFRLLSASGA